MFLWSSGTLTISFKLKFFVEKLIKKTKINEKEVWVGAT